MSDAVRPNHLYWQSKRGEEYRDVQNRRSGQGSTNYKEQERWLVDRLSRLTRSGQNRIRLLDFGCGYGRIARLCADLGAIDYHGFDFSTAMVAPLLADPPAAFRPDIVDRVVVAPTLEGQFEPGTFDVILSISVLIHNDEQTTRRLLDTLLKLRRAGGELILIENPIVSRTTFQNLWHAGCWSHSFCTYAGEGINVLVDEDVHPAHCAYVLSDANGEPKFSVKSAGKIGHFESVEQIYVGRPDVFASASGDGDARPVDEVLQIAAALDANEGTHALEESALRGGAPFEVVDPNIRITDEYRELMRKVVLERFIGSQSVDYRPEALENAIYEHVESRFVSFKAGVLPWLERLGGVKGREIVEVGSGTGASTLPLVSLASHVHCFEIHEPSLTVAEFRLRLAKYSNFSLHKQPFSGQEATGLGQVDGVFLAATLEHMTFGECIDTLKNAWAVVRPGGWLCVVETPNRLCPFDFHTALLPFFSMLPPEVRMAYASRSPRPEFAAAFSPEASLDKDGQLESLARWGAGISYHEFEIAIGPDMHQHIVADGHEPEIEALIGTTREDTAIKAMLDEYAPNVHRAFARRALNLILRKPDVS